MKVCLIQPPKIIHAASLHAKNSYAYSQSPSLGLATIAGVLKSAGHEVRAVDCLGEGIFNFYRHTNLKIVINGIDLAEMMSRIPIDTEVFGITMMFSYEWFYYEAIVNRIRKQFPQAKIIAGGEHASAEALNILELCCDIDYVVIGEGDETIIELLEIIKSGGSLLNVNGIAFQMECELIKTAPRKRIKAVDDLPLPLWDIFPIFNYLNNNCAHSLENRRAIPILMQRGCPYECTFCTNKAMWGRSLILRSPKAIVEEIKTYIEKYQIEHIDICDSVGILNRPWVIELLTLMKKENLNITWSHPAGTRSEILDEVVLALCKETGAKKIIYAPESGSDELLKRIKKKVNLAKLTSSMKTSIKLGMVAKTHIMFGLPGQNLKEVISTLFFTLKLAIIGVEDLSVHSFVAHPGSQEYQSLIDSGKIDIQKIKNDGLYPQFLLSQSFSEGIALQSWSEGIPHWILSRLERYTYFMFYGVYYLLRPWKIWQNYRNIVVLRKPISGIENLIYRKLYSKGRMTFAELPEILGLEKYDA